MLSYINRGLARSILFVVASLTTVGSVFAKDEAANVRTTIPLDSGLPVIVRTATYFLSVPSFDENAGLFDAMVDLRFTWMDLRFKYPPSEGLNGYKEVRGSKADQAIANMWVPDIRISNQEGEPKYVERRLRTFPNGRIELITRITAKFKTDVDVTSFPFDRQHLTLNIRMREDTTDRVSLVYRPDDVNFSRAMNGLEVEGWDTGLVRLRSESIKGWNGDRYAQINASLELARQPLTTIASIFVPLVASLFIPFLALWLNRYKREDGEYETDAFELANIVIGGLFSVVALSFTVSSSYQVLAVGDNTVMRLLGLNYVTIAVCMSIAVLCFQFGVTRRLFHKHIEHAFFGVLRWAVPTIVLGTAAAFFAVASL